MESSSTRMFQGIKNVRMHGLRVNLRFSAFSVSWKVTHAPWLLIVQVIEKKKKMEKKRFVPRLATSRVSNMYDETAT